MITIRYRIAYEFDDRMAVLTAEDLDYRCFLGDIWLSIGNFQLAMTWGWIPLVHFATMLSIAVRDLIDGSSRSEIPFTENDDAIYLARKGENVQVSSTFTFGIGITSLSALRKVAAEFAIMLFDDIMQRHPQMSTNIVIAERLKLINAIALE